MLFPYSTASAKLITSDTTGTMLRLDCRAAFSLEENGKIKPVTKITPYDEWIYYL